MIRQKELVLPGKEVLQLHKHLALDDTSSHWEFIIIKQRELNGQKGPTPIYLCLWIQMALPSINLTDAFESVGSQLRWHDRITLNTHQSSANVLRNYPNYKAFKEGYWSRRSATFKGRLSLDRPPDTQFCILDEGCCCGTKQQWGDIVDVNNSSVARTWLRKTSSMFCTIFI